MFYWSKEGLIRKILMRQITPDPSFWLTFEQTLELDDDIEVATWPAEKMNVDVSDSEEEEGPGDNVLEEDAERAFRKNDVVEDGGASLLVVMTDRYGIQSEAKEYIPGGLLAIVVQVVDAFIYLKRRIWIRSYAMAFEYPYSIFMHISMTSLKHNY